MTRRTVLELCESLGITAEQAPVPLAVLRAADEVFLITTAGGILPVTRVDEIAIRNGPGPYTRRLHRAYWERRAAGWHGEPVDYDIIAQEQAAG